MSRGPSFQATRPLTRSQTRSHQSRSLTNLCAKPPHKTRLPSRTRSTKTLVQDLQSRLQNSASPTYAAWLTRYLRDTPCRGLKNPQVEEITHSWAQYHDLYTVPHPRERSISRDLFASQWMEDKHAAIIFLHRLQKLERFGCGDKKDDDIVFVERLFDDGLLQNWSTVDSFSLRVVAGLADDEAGRDKVSSWVHAENLWRARAGVVGLIPYVKTGCMQVLENCKVLVKREERFAKTAVGWALREVQRVDQDKMVAFLEPFAGSMSMEAARNAAKHVPEKERKRLLALVKSGGMMKQ